MKGEPYTNERYVLASWKALAIVAATAVTIVGGFYLGGPGLGMAVGALAAASIVVMAARLAPRGPIVPAPLPDLRRHFLLVARGSLEDSRTISQIAHLCEPPAPDAARSEIRVLVPAPGRFLDRWSCDRRTARARAQRRCVLSVASLAKAGLAADAAVGDEDVLVAVEDELRTFPATDVILVGREEEHRGEEKVAAELRSRLQADFLHLQAPAPARAPEAVRQRL